MYRHGSGMRDSGTDGAGRALWIAGLRTGDSVAVVIGTGKTERRYVPMLVSEVTRHLVTIRGVRFRKATGTPSAWDQIVLPDGSFRIAWADTTRIEPMTEEEQKVSRK